MITHIISVQWVRFKGATDTFEAWFKAVKDGRILKLVNKEATGIRYSLVRLAGN